MGIKRTVIMLVAAAILSLPCGAQACLLGTIDIVYDGAGAGGTAELWGGGLEGATRRTGVYMLDKTSGTGDGELWENGLIGAFCIELSEVAPGYTKTYGVVLPEDGQKPTTFLGEKIGFEKAEYVREIWGRFFDPAWVGSGPSTLQQNSDAEAFAAAIWEIIYEDLPASPSMWDVRVDSTSGPLGFRATGLDSDTANSILHSLDGTGPKADLRAFVYCGKQDYITEVPEPATILLLGLSSLALLRGRRK